MAKARKPSSTKRVTRAAAAKAGALTLADSRTVRVSVSPKQLHDFNAITKILGSVLGELGCLACCSGFDILWDVERNFVADARGRVRRG